MSGTVTAVGEKPAKLLTPAARIPNQSQRCRVVQRIPSRTSEVTDCPEDGGAGTWDINTRHAALARKLAASTMKAVDVPPRATITPPMAGPAKACPRVWLPLLNALPCVRRSPGNSSGMIARYAG